MNEAEKIFDGLLVLQYQQGNKKALSFLVKRWHAKLCRQAYWYINDADKAKDIAQDSWTVILKNIDTLKNKNSFGSWALMIVNRKSIDWLRKEKKISKKLHQYYENSKTDYDGIVDNKVHDMNNRLTKVVINAIEELPENQQIVLRLFYVEEYAIQEISDILEVSKGTIKSRLFYAREKLKSIIKTRKNEK